LLRAKRAEQKLFLREKQGKKRKKRGKKSGFWRFKKFF
jgi:hypothetical protein